MPERRHFLTRRQTWRILLGLALAVAVLASLFYGLRTYRTFLLLQQAQSLGAPETSSIRGWMTLDYLATAYEVDGARLSVALGLPETTGKETTIRAIAETRSQAVFDTVADVQKAVAALTDRNAPPAAEEDEAGWFDSLTQSVMSGVLIYGYPVLLATVFFGSLGFPVPSGPVTAFAGSLSSSGQIGAALTFVITMVGSLLGDVAAYAIGRAARPAWLERWGGWIGYTEGNRKRAQQLFERWGGATVVLAMSVVSQVSSVIGLLAGLSHWPLASYLAAATLGRLLWTLGYFGLGYVASTNFAAASGFLGNLGAALLAFLCAAGAAALLRRSINAPAESRA